MVPSAGISTILSLSNFICPILEPVRQIRPKSSTLSAKAGGSLRAARQPPSCNGSLSRSHVNQPLQVDSSSPKCRCSLESFESLFCYDKPIPEEVIEQPVGIPVAAREIGNNPRCILCEAKGVVLCSTCSGSGLYIDSILESQGILVKVRCLGKTMLRGETKCIIGILPLLYDVLQFALPTKTLPVLELGCGGTGNTICSECGGRGFQARAGNLNVVDC